jgi:hypothetical protein
MTIFASSVHQYTHARQDIVYLLEVVTATSVNRSACPRVECEYLKLHALLEIGIIPRDVRSTTDTTLR